jgi:hypothetical protein
MACKRESVMKKKKYKSPANQLAKALDKQIRNTPAYKKAKKKKKK